jgi:hypothetical protein
LCNIKYDLVAICLHVGDSPRAGHYFSVVRNIKDDIWRRYNDERVTVGSKQLDQKFLNHATPYICFYKGERLHLTNANNITANNLAENSRVRPKNSQKKNNDYKKSIISSLYYWAKNEKQIHENYYHNY